MVLEDALWLALRWVFIAVSTMLGLALCAVVVLGSAAALVATVVTVALELGMALGLTP